jgi:Na+/phosphate symporter
VCFRNSITAEVPDINLENTKREEVLVNEGVQKSLIEIYGYQNSADAAQHEHAATAAAKFNSLHNTIQL